MQVPPLRSMTMEKYRKVIAFFKELGFQFDISRFDDRLIAQKLVCLLDLRGIDFGYSCSLYVRGPYSPDLTQDLYAFTREFETLETGSRLECRRERGGRGARQDLRSQTRPSRSRRNVRLLCPAPGKRSARSRQAGKTAQAVLFRGADCAWGIEGKAIPLYPDRKGSRSLKRGDRDLAAGIAHFPGA